MIPGELFHNYMTCSVLKGFSIFVGFTINRLCWAVGKGLKLAKIKHPAAKWIPTITGLLSIPLIIHPIDKGVDVLMDETYRKYVL
jgi:mitochondrial fission process protein 1